jgi:hypothetical protein
MTDPPHFALLDGPDRASTSVGDNVRFAILAAPDTGARATQVLGGAAELRADPEGRPPGNRTDHVTHVASVGDVELALGETRDASGRVAATFIGAAQRDGVGRVERYLLGRSPGVRFASPRPGAEPRPPEPRERDGAAGYFADYFARLDGPAPLSALDLVADDAQFALLYAAGTDDRSRQFIGGPAELRAFTEAGDMRGWAHHVLRGVHVDDVELVVGETRWDDGRHLGTFVCAAQLDGDGRMVRYLTGRTPGLRLRR